MKPALILLATLFASTAMADDLSDAQAIAEKLYVSMAQTLPSQLGETDVLRAECGYRDVYITCVITDNAGDVGYTHGITVKFDHYGRDLAVDSVEYIEH